MFCQRGVQAQQASRVAGQDLFAFGGRAGQPVDELPGDAGRAVGVVAAEQQTPGAQLGVAVLQRREPVADGVDVQPVQVLADWLGQLRLAG